MRYRRRMAPRARTPVRWRRAAGCTGPANRTGQVLADYPYLEREDVLQALRYAAWRCISVYGKKRPSNSAGVRIG